jgi:hypothetical protein
LRIEIHNSLAKFSSPSWSRRCLNRRVSLPGLFGARAGDFDGVASINLVMYRPYRTGVLGEVFLPALLMAVTRGCSRGDEELGSGAWAYGVAGARATGGG